MRSPLPNRRAAHWLASAGSVLAFLAPKGLCPICIAASGGALSAIGLGFLAVDSVIRWVLPATLTLGLVGFVFAVQRHRRYWVLALAFVGALALYGGWLFTAAPVLYAGTALLLAASAFNFWSQRHPRAALVQIGTKGE